MKIIKYLWGLSGIISLVILASTVQAEGYTLTQTPTVFTAKARTTGTAKIKFDAAIFPIDNPNGDSPGKAAVFPGDYTEITWNDGNDVNLDSSPAGWMMASYLIRVDSTLTAFNGAIQIVTDNKTGPNPPIFSDRTPPVGETPGTADYIFKANNPDSDPAGLVLNVAGHSQFTLPLAWTIKSSTREATSPDIARRLFAKDPASTDSTGGPGNRFQWISIMDKHTPDIDWNLNGELCFDKSNPLCDLDKNGQPDDTRSYDEANLGSTDFRTIVIDASKGLHVSQGDAGFDGQGAGERISYIYFETNFQNAFAPAKAGDPALEYKTNHLILEAFTY